MIRIARIQDANVYLEGTSTHGQASEVILPNVGFTNAEHKPLGLFGGIKINTGIEPMEATIKWLSPSNEILKALANPKDTVKLMVRSNQQVFEGSELIAEQPIIVHLRGNSANYGLGTFKKGDDTETETKLNITYFKHIVNGEELVEIDVPNNIFRISGKDLLKDYKVNLGI